MVKSIFLFIVAIVIFTLIAPVAFLVNLLRSIISPDKRLSDYLYTIAIGIDQLGGSILYNQPDWTVSSWTYYQAQNHKEHKLFMKLIDFLFGEGHCQKSFEHEMGLLKQYQRLIDLEVNDESKATNFRK